MSTSYFKIFSRVFHTKFAFMEENLRFIELIDALRMNGVISDYVQVSKELGTNKAGISDIKSGRKKLSINLLRRLKLSYPQINIDWVITGNGEPFTRRPGEKDGEKEQAEEKAGNSSSGGIEDKLLAIIQEKDGVIREQAEEIGRLRERVLQLELGKGKDASAATTSGVANAG